VNPSNIRAWVLTAERGCSTCCSTLGGPVEGAGGAAATAALTRNMSKLRLWLRVGSMVALPTYFGLYFLPGHVGGLVVAEPVGEALGVVLVDDSIVRGEGDSGGGLSFGRRRSW
jgi:hypothetical protein